MRYRTVLFDFDGTLVDSSRGILQCAGRTLRDMGYEPPDQDSMRIFIGPPLRLSFRNACGMSEQEAAEAVHIYRSKYAEGGMFELEVYPGIPQLLEKLQKAGIRCAVASVKMERIVKKTLEHLELAKYFEAICGASEDINISTKEHIIKEALKKTHTQRTDALMVGDSDYDAKGAQQAGVDFCAVLWGFGFHSEADAMAYAPRFIAEEVSVLEDYLLK